MLNNPVPPSTVGAFCNSARLPPRCSWAKIVPARTKSITTSALICLAAFIVLPPEVIIHGMQFIDQVTRDGVCPLLRSKGDWNEVLM